ncbi:putative copper-exporting P-type ATPase V [Planctomycetes bacterium Pan216]|uniref:Putative copper-exporting P-type ATPase V n=1 Tax=Kolteria novifilia TaxID=2527975 RepID=A0A518B1L9_9BACT|nr:putative copper-exporting P-type ATPase V [Planctomycetes bacterium Pan216]
MTAHTRNMGLAPPRLPRTESDANASAATPSLPLLGDAPSSVWWRLGASVFLAGQSMLLALAVNLSEPVGTARLTLQSLILVATFVVVVLLGFPLAAAALREVRSGRLTIEALFLLTMAGALLASLQSMLLGTGPVYFEVISILLIVYTANRLLAARTRRGALDAARAWTRRLSKANRIEASGNRTVVLTSVIAVGDLVEVNPGRLVPVDGVIERGVGFVRESPLTGEPFSRVVRVGDRLLAGSVAEDARFELRASRSGTDREIDHLLAIVELASQRPTSMQRRADRWARLFVPVVALIAVATLLGWTFAAGWNVGLFQAMAVLLIACPCAFGLATPIAVAAALGRLAEEGLIARQADVLEGLARVDRVVFDKTGTLTDEVSVVNVTFFDHNGRDRAVFEAELLGWLAEIESCSDHPVARALADIAPSAESSSLAALELDVVPGAGLVARFRDAAANRRELRVGRGDWLDPEGSVLAEPDGSHSPSSEMGVLVELDGRLVASIRLRERWRGGFGEVIRDLRQLGLEVEIMTGDRSARAVTLHDCEIHAGMTPTEKREAVIQRQESGQRCLFVGDGINDSAAMAEAEIAVALGSGSELAIEAAPLTLHHGDLSVLGWAIRFARRTTGLVESNMRWALGYNLVGVSLAVSGYLHPVAAATLMVGSSLFIGARSMRLQTVLPRTPANRPRPIPIEERLS